MNPEISKSRGFVNSGAAARGARKLDSRTVKNRWLAIPVPLVLLLACGTDEPARRPEPAKSQSATDAAFPPHGPIELRYAPPPAEGTLFQLQVKYEGRTEVQNEGANAGDPEYLDEQVQMELDYRQLSSPRLRRRLRRRSSSMRCAGASCASAGGERGLEVATTASARSRTTRSRSTCGCAAEGRLTRARS
jgi:hypothetical protein